MKLKIRLIWRKAMTDFNGVVTEYVYKTDDVVLPEDAQAFQFQDTYDNYFYRARKDRKIQQP